MYGNSISTINSVDEFNMKIVNKETSSIYCDFKIDKHDGIYSFIDFIPADSNKYKGLSSGLYDLSVTYGQDTERRSIYLKGAITDYDKRDEEEDLQKSTISNTHLSFEAGKEGYFYIQINSKSGFRKNTHEGYNFKVRPTIEDPSFTYTPIRSGTNGVFIIKVSSTKSVDNNKLKIEISSTKSKNPVLIETLNPKMTVIPGKIKVVKIDPSCIKENKDELIDANTDNDIYKFTIHSYDEFGNKNYANQDIIKLNLSPFKAENNYSYKINNDGSITYMYKLAIVGQYKVMTEYSDLIKKIRYINVEYKLNVNIGKVDLHNSIIENVKSTVDTGRLAELKIYLRDKKNNIITPTNISLTNVRIFSSDQVAIKPTIVIKDNYLLYSAYITKAGKAAWSVKTNENEELLTTPLEVQINPSDIDISATIYMTDKNNKINSKYPYIISNTAKSIEVLAEKYDIYGNVLSDKDKIKFNYVAFTGNYMEDISFSISERNTQFAMNMPLKSENKTAVYTLNHLVKGYGYNIKLDTIKNKKILVSSSTIIVKSENELKDAINQGGKINIGNNINISKDITIINNVEIDLNNFTLTIANSITVDAELIIKNGNINLTDKSKSLIILKSGSKYFGYNVSYMNAKSIINLTGYGYVEIVDGKTTNINSLFENTIYDTNKIVIYGNFDATGVKTAFINKECSLKIYGGKYGFSTNKYIMSSIVELPVLLTTNKDDTGHGNGPLNASNTEISVNKFKIPVGESDILTITFKNKQGLLFNDDVTIVSNDEVNVTKFNQVEITPLDKSLTYQYQTGIYSKSTISIKSEFLFKNKLTLKITDKKGGIKIFDIPCNIVHSLYPDPTKTVFVYPPEKIISPPNNYISFTFKLYDNFGNPFEDACDEMKEKVISIVIDGNPEERKAIDGCETTGLFSINRYRIDYPPFNRNINVMYYYKGGSTYLFENDINVSISTNVDYSKSEIQCFKCESVIAGEKYSLTVSLFDVNGECFNANYTDNIPLGVKISPINSENPPMYYSFKSASLETDNCKNMFEWVYDTPINKSGLYNIEIFANTGNQNITLREYTQKVEEEAVDMDHIYVKKETFSNIKVEDYYEFSVYAKDKFDNLIHVPFDNVFTPELRDENGEKYNEESIIDYQYYFDGFKINYKFSVNNTKPVRIYFKSGKNGVFENMKSIYIDDKKISDPNGVFDTVKFKPGDCHENFKSVNDTNLKELKALEQPVYLYVQCFDKHGNKNNEGGAKIDALIKYKKEGSEEDIEEKPKIFDNLNGIYTITFIPKIEGTYQIIVKLNEMTLLYQESYQLRNIPLCPPEDKPENSFLCPNSNTCVDPDKKSDCLEKDELCSGNTTHPFNCKKREGLSVDKCVVSFSDCACPKGYAKCEDWYQKQCYPIDRDFECPFVLKSNCKNKKPYTALCDDGICRLRKDLKPNKYVCPYGYYQCSDLTCRLKPEDCPIYKDCGDNELKCDDQSCSTSNDRCPSRVTCKNSTYVVCPNGNCVENELLCNPIKCIEPLSYLCPSGTCAKSAEDCPKGIVCGHTYSLCEDNICRNDCREESDDTEEEIE
jgi:hypothetical protein